MKIERALISCWDKQDLLKLAKPLVDHGVEIISSGGTASYLLQNQIPVTPIEKITGFKEILGGRVKTLHPAIHAGILAKRNSEHLQQLETQGIKPIDLVVVNLYPFVEKVSEQKSLAEMIEYIDIGGPAMLRAAAKNHEFVTTLHHSCQYEEFLEVWTANKYSVPSEIRLKWAGDIFYYTAYYDSQISRYLDAQKSDDILPDRFVQFFQKQQDLRYGENPHQPGAIYRERTLDSQAGEMIEKLWGKEMSFNNYVDVAAAFSATLDFDEPAVAIIKHTNPCGLAVDQYLSHAFKKAMEGDPVSAYGGIVASNRKIDQETAELIKETFFECVIAPGYEENALKSLQTKKNLRILKIDPENFLSFGVDYKYLPFGLLCQQADIKPDDTNSFFTASSRKPSDNEQEDLLFAWKVVKHVKSNAIVFVKSKQLIGVGAGQMSRVDSVKLAARKAKDLGQDLNGAVMASDAFFPFRDGIDEAAGYGITAVIQPGGSIRDEEVLKAVDEQKMAMILTKIRHFKH